MELFEFIKVIFNRPSDYSSISPSEKRKHFFMCQRRFAIQFPMEANVLQHLKINQQAVIDWWQKFLRSKYSSVPGWMYTTGAKKSQEIKEKKINVSNDTIKEYCKTFEIDPHSVRDALEFFQNDMVKELKEFENMIKQK
jgi:hypothetical protein